MSEGEARGTDVSGMVKPPGTACPVSGLPDILALACRVLLGTWFLYSGGMKIFGSGLDRFTRDVANYQLVKPPWDAVAAYSVPWLEVVAGLCLMLGILRRGAILTIAGLVVVFSISVGWAWSKGLDISCGCHGGDAPIQYWHKAAEFAGYFILLGWLWWRESYVVQPFRVSSARTDEDTLKG